MFFFPGLEPEKITSPAYILLFEAGLRLLKNDCLNFMFATAYKAGQPTQAENLARHNDFKSQAARLGFSWIEFKVRHALPGSRKWYKELALLLGLPRLRHMEGGLFHPRKPDTPVVALPVQLGLSREEMILVGSRLLPDGTFLLKAQDDERALMFRQGQPTDAWPFTPEAVLNFYRELRGAEVEFLGFGEEYFRSGSSMFSESLMWIVKKELLENLRSGAAGLAADSPD